MMALYVLMECESAEMETSGRIWLVLPPSIFVEGSPATVNGSRRLLLAHTDQETLYTRDTLCTLVICLA